MPNIKPVSDLRNYNEVLKDIGIGAPVFLTKNGHGKFVIMDIAEYEQLNVALKLLAQLNQGEQSAKDNGWLTLEEVEASLGVKHV